MYNNKYICKQTVQSSSCHLFHPIYSFPFSAVTCHCHGNATRAKLRHNQLGHQVAAEYTLPPPAMRKHTSSAPTSEGALDRRQDGGRATGPPQSLLDWTTHRAPQQLIYAQPNWHHRRSPEHTTDIDQTARLYFTATMNNASLVKSPRQILNHSQCQNKSTNWKTPRQSRR